VRTTSKVELLMTLRNTYPWADQCLEESYYRKANDNYQYKQYLANS